MGEDEIPDVGAVHIGDEFVACGYVNEAETLTDGEGEGDTERKRRRPSDLSVQ